MKVSQKIQLAPEQQCQFELILMRGILRQLKNEGMLTDAQFISALDKINLTY